MGIVGQVFERARPFIEGIKTPGGNAGETCPYGVGHRVGRRLCSKGPAHGRHQAEQPGQHDHQEHDRRTPDRLQVVAIHVNGASRLERVLTR